MLQRNRVSRVSRVFVLPAASQTAGMEECLGCQQKNDDLLPIFPLPTVFLEFIFGSGVSKKQLGSSLQVRWRFGCQGFYKEVKT